MASVATSCQPAVSVPADQLTISLCDCLQHYLPQPDPACSAEHRRPQPWSSRSSTGLIRRLPHSNRYTLTDDGIRIAVFYTKIYNRLLVPLTAANQPQAPRELRHALRALDHHVDDYIAHARLKPAA